MRELAADHNHYVAAREDDVLVGYAGISRLGRKPPFEYEIHTIGVDPAYQGRGIGRRMLDALLTIAADAVVTWRSAPTMHAAIALYHSVGFTEVGLRKRYYRVSGADAYTMRREAPPAGDDQMAAMTRSGNYEPTRSWPSKDPATKQVSGSPGSRTTER